MASGRTAILAVVLLAGCAATPAPTLTADATRDLTLPDGLVPGARPVVASFVLAEDIQGSLTPFDEQPKSRTRDVTVTYHGIHVVFDEFARPVPAYIVRVPEVVRVQEGIGPLAVSHEEEHVFESQFDVADGRLIAVVDVTAGQAQFSDPAFRHPFAPPKLLFLAVHALGGDFSRIHRLYEREGGALDMHIEPFEGARPLPGDCVAWQVVARWNPVPQSGPQSENATAGPPTVMCLEATSPVPLWMHVEGYGGNASWTRKTPGILLPPLEGEALPPVAYERLPWEPVHVLVEVAPPMLAPPREASGTWASGLAERLAAFHEDPGYVLYRRESADAYVDVAVIGVDFGELRVLNVSIPVGTGFTGQSIFSVTDSEQHYFNSVWSREGTQEQPSVHRTTRPGARSEGSIWREPTAAELMPLVGDASIEGQLAPVLRPWDRLSFLYTSLGSSDMADAIALWSGMTRCGPDAEGWSFTVDARAGALFAARRLQGDACEGPGLDAWEMARTRREGWPAWQGFEGPWPMAQG